MTSQAQKLETHSNGDCAGHCSDVSQEEFGNWSRLTGKVSKSTIRTHFMQLCIQNVNVKMGLCHVTNPVPWRRYGCCSSHRHCDSGLTTERGGVRRRGAYMCWSITVWLKLRHSIIFNTAANKSIRHDIMSSSVPHQARHPTPQLSTSYPSESMCG